MKHLGVVNIGAAGTFVVPKPVGATELRAEFARRLPFDTRIVICRGRGILSLISRDVFAGYPVRPGTVRFVSVLTRAPRTAPALPLRFPDKGRWLMKVLARDGRFVIGLYRRHMKVIGYLGALDRVFGVPVTTRNWNTMKAVATLLEKPAPASRGKDLRG